MNDLKLIACGAGLRDGLNPCMFMTCAVFIALGLCFTPGALRVGRLRTIFVTVYVFCFLVFNFGPAQIFLFHKNYIFAAKIIYLILGAGAFVFGLLFFKDWVLLHRARPLPVRDGEKINPFTANGIAVALTTVLLGLVLCALATLWPIDTYIMILCNEALLKGQWQTVMPLLVCYIIASLWPLWLVWAFLSIKNLRPSLFKIVCSSIFFTASTCVILMFK